MLRFGAPYAEEQGLVHMGKGTIGINPFFHDNQVLDRVALAGLLSVIISFIDAKSCTSMLSLKKRRVKC